MSPNGRPETRLSSPNTSVPDHADCDGPGAGPGSPFPTVIPDMTGIWGRTLSRRPQSNVVECCYYWMASSLACFGYCPAVRNRRLDVLQALSGCPMSNRTVISPSRYDLRYPPVRPASCKTLQTMRSTLTGRSVDRFVPRCSTFERMQCLGALASNSSLRSPVMVEQPTARRKKVGQAGVKIFIARLTHRERDAFVDRDIRDTRVGRRFVTWRRRREKCPHLWMTINKRRAGAVLEQDDLWTSDGKDPIPRKILIK